MWWVHTCTHAKPPRHLAYSIAKRAEGLVLSSWYFVVPAPCRISTGLSWFVKELNKFWVACGGASFLALTRRETPPFSSLEIILAFLSDNVTLQIDGVLYLRILDPYKVWPGLVGKEALCF